MGWPNNFVQGVYDETGKVVGIDDGAGGAKYLENIVTSSYVPVGLVGLNGTTDAVNAGGILTCQAMPRLFSEGWVRLPAGMVSGRGAGYHYFVALGSPSLTSVQLKDLFVADGSVFVPYLPDTTPANAVGTTTAVAQTTGSAINLMRVVVGGGLLGKNGYLETWVFTSSNNTANSKTVRLFYENTYMLLYSHLNTNVILETFKRMYNRGKETLQIISPYAAITQNATAGDVATYTVDTTVNQYLKITAQMVSTLDCVFLEGSKIRTNFM